MKEEKSFIKVMNYVLLEFIALQLNNIYNSQKNNYTSIILYLDCS